MSRCFYPAEMLLPRKGTDYSKWAVIACDQYTSQPEYWKRAEQYVGDAPSALNLILPELYLGGEDETERIDRIHTRMNEYEKTVLEKTPCTYLYLERTQPDGRIRRGIVGMIDLDSYSFLSGTDAAIRATEGTVLSRIPPRVRVRRGAPLELPHVMLLADDPSLSMFRPFLDGECFGEKCYDFDLMQGGGHLCGWLCSEKTAAAINEAVDALAAKDPFLFAVGDGNHSLASAKQYYEELKETMTAQEAAEHPARFALCEVVSLYDDALDFEPIYRVLFRADLPALEKLFAPYTVKIENAHRVTVLAGGEERTLYLPKDLHPLAVGALQPILDGYLAEHPESKIDYIHGEASVRSLCETEGSVGFLFSGMEKWDLFPSVRVGGSLPRKTFSMGHADDKRFYVECRRILPNE